MQQLVPISAHGVPREGAVTPELSITASHFAATAIRKSLEFSTHFRNPHSGEACV